MNGWEDWFRAHIQAYPKRLWLFFATSVLMQVWLYIAVNEFAFERGVAYRHIVLPIDDWIPFLPDFIYIYATLYLVPLLTFGLLLRHSLLCRFIIGFYLLISIHYLIFILYPVENTLRPFITGEISQAVALCQFFYSIDRPYNSFPSMHVSMVFFAAYCLRRARQSAAQPMFIVGSFIFLSTLFTKQHYLLDGLVGGLLGVCVASLVVRPQRSS